MSAHPIEVTRESAAYLARYAQIPVAFEVLELLELTTDADGAPQLLPPRAIASPWVKDYDALDGGPARWPDRFDVSTWGLFVARLNGEPVGGAAVAIGTKDMLEAAEPEGLAILWDLRVAPHARRHGVGTVLFGAAEAWARGHGSRQLRAETQNINVPACRFYQRRGCVLRSARPGAYPQLPDEIGLLWYRDLGAP